MKEDYEEDEDFGTIWKEVQSREQFQGFCWKQGFIFTDHRLCVPKTTMRMKIIQELHSNNLGGHVGMNKSV